MSTNVEKFGGDFLEATIEGPLVIRFPIAMFEPDGVNVYRVHRSTFLTEAAKWYDTAADGCRLKLNEADPEVERAPLENLGMAIIDVAAIARAAQPDDDPEN